MDLHREFTFSWLIFVIMVPIHLLMTFAYFNNNGERPMDSTEYLILSLTVAIGLILFYGMSTRVTSDEIIVSFGIGLFRKKIRLERVISVQIVKSPWYYGWGIRFIPNGMLYNVSGFLGVELKFNDTKRIIRIGTKDPGRLKRVIEERLRLAN